MHAGDARDRRGVDAIGRDARLELVFACRGGRTALVHAYVEPPLRVGRVFEIGSAAYAIIVCAGPGVFAGDRLQQSIHVERGARVLLASQAALQVHPAPPRRVHKDPPCMRSADGANGTVLQHRYDVADGGELHCQWDPMIPFAGARLRQRFDLRIAGGSRFYWSDAAMSGRSGRGEDWRFAELDHELRLTIDGSLTYLERYRLQPHDRSVGHPWIAGGGRYFGTTIVHHRAATPAAAEALQQRLADFDVRAGVDSVEPGVIVGRMLAERGASFAAARTAARELVLDRIFSAPQLVFRR